MTLSKIKVIAFDADDTLWVNEPYYQDAEKQFIELLSPFLSIENISPELFKIEMANLAIYGYGAKAFMLSMIETAIRVSDGKIPAATITKIINLGKSLLEQPIELLDGIEHVLPHLKNSYKLIVATKGDLLDQQRKLNNSGILHHFNHVEIMHDKNELEYQKLINHLNIKSEEFLMVGNSVKSDVLPVIAIGGRAIHIPYHITWQHESHEETENSNNYLQISKISELIEILKN